jgi:hypothetical protein
VSFDIYETHNEIVTCDRKETAISLKGHGDNGGWYD